MITSHLLFLPNVLFVTLLVSTWKMIVKAHCSVFENKAFDLTVPIGGFEIGHFRLGAGKRRVASDGHWVCLSAGSLAEGIHKISFSGNSKRGFHTARIIRCIRFNAST